MAETKFLDNAGLTHLFEKINAKFSKLGHKHNKADITDFAHSHNDLYYGKTEVDSKLNGKSNTSHNHDGRYYTESEINSKLAGKSDTSHSHSTHLTTEIAASTDLNTITNPGWYKCSLNVKATGLKNCPTRYAFALEVLSNAGTTQKLYEHMPSVQKVYTRNYYDYDNVWGDWKRVYTTADKPTAGEIGAAASSHTHTKSQITDFAHTHDDRYYTETEVDSKLNGKANSRHSHTKSQITDFPTSMPASDVYSWAKQPSKPSYTASEVGAAPASHSHSYLPLSGGTVSGNVHFASIGDKAKSKGITWDGSTDGASIYYETRGSDSGHLVLNMIDDPNGTVDIAAGGAVQSYFGYDGTFHGNVYGNASSASSVAWANVSGRPSSMPASDVSAWAKAPTKPTYTKAEVGLGNVDNTADSAKSVKYATSAGSAGAVAWANVSGKPTTFAPSEHNHNDLYYQKSEVDGKLSGKAAASHKHGAADITSVNASAINGVIASANLPSFVDDVIEGYLNGGKFYKEKKTDGTYATEITAESGKIYINLNDSKTYRWSGSAYVVISETIALGETSSTAYRGDRGAAAYNHAAAKGSAFASGLYKITTNAQGHVTGATAVQKSDITGLGIPAQDTVYTHPTSSGNKHIPSGGAAGQFLKWSADGTAVWAADNNTTYSNFKGATSSAAGGSGLVPAPATGAANRYLRSDGTWQVPPDNNTWTALKGATTDAAGTAGYVAAPAKGQQGYFLRGDATWAALSKETVGLGNVDNTADSNKSVKYAASAGSASSATKASTADSATKATQDSAGQQINTTYIKGLSVSGRTVTYTRGDGTTGTITTQDTNTTYNALTNDEIDAAFSAVFG